MLSSLLVLVLTKITLDIQNEPYSYSYLHSSHGQTSLKTSRYLIYTFLM